MSDYQIALVPGDGVGPELTEATLKVLNAVQKRFNLGLNIVKVDAGDNALNGRAWLSPKTL